MQSLNSESGSLVADHCHTFTSQRLYYRATYRCEGPTIVWQASVRLARDKAEELCGVTGMGSHTGTIPAVKDAVEAAIDRQAFFESDWGGLAALAHSGASHHPGQAAHG